MKTKIAIIVSLMALLMCSCVIKDYEDSFDHFYIINNTETDLIISTEFGGTSEIKLVSPSSTIEIEILQGAFGRIDFKLKLSILDTDNTLIREYASNSLIPWEVSSVEVNGKYESSMTLTITDELLYGESPEQE